MGSRGKSGSGDVDLHTAARSGDLRAVEMILSSNPLAVNSRDNHSRTPLHLAAWAGHVNVINYLCKHKADAGAAAMDDMGAIHFAAQKGHLEVVRALVSSGVSIKASNRKGMTALHYAVQGSHLDLAKYLLRKGADLWAKTKAGKTAVELATDDEVCKLLSEKIKDGDNKTSEKKVVEKDDEDVDNAEVKAMDGEGEVQEGEQLKRKNNEDDGEERSFKRKKTKMILNHLLTFDDTQEDEYQ